VVAFSISVYYPWSMEFDIWNGTGQSAGWAQPVSITKEFGHYAAALGLLVLRRPEDMHAWNCSLRWGQVGHSLVSGWLGGACFSPAWLCHIPLAIMVQLCN